MSAADGAALKAADIRSLFADLADHPVLILAVSGGPDSTALLVLAARWRKALKRGPKLVAITIDHGLRAEARREAQQLLRPVVETFTAGNETIDLVAARALLARLERSER